MRQLPYDTAACRHCKTDASLRAGLLFLFQSGLLGFLYGQRFSNPASLAPTHSLSPAPFFGLLSLLPVLFVCVHLQIRRFSMYQDSALLASQATGPAFPRSASPGQQQKAPYWSHLLCSSDPQRVSAVLYTPDGAVSEFVPAGLNCWTLVRKGAAIAEARRQGPDCWQIFSRKGLSVQARRESNGEWTFTDPTGQPVAWIYDSTPLENVLPRRRTITIWCADGGTAGLYLLEGTQPPLFPQQSAPV